MKKTINNQGPYHHKDVGFRVLFRGYHPGTQKRGKNALPLRTKELKGGQK